MKKDIKVRAFNIKLGAKTHKRGSSRDGKN